MAPRSVLILAALALALGGCSKLKRTAKTPGSSGGAVSTEDTGLMGDGADVPDAASGQGQGQGASAGQGAGQSAGGGATPGKPAAEPPRIEPPDLDVGAAAQREQLARHLETARAALRGPSRDPDQAIREARAALAVDATSIDAVVLIAHAYHAKRLPDTAEVMLDMVFQARKQARTNPGVFYVYGLIYDQTNRPEQAMVAYQKVIELQPGHRNALVNLGVHYLRNRNYADAVTLHERLTRELGVSTAATWTNLGSAYRGRSGDYPGDSGRRSELLRQAETAYKRALSLDKSYANVYYNLGLLYLDAETFPGPDGAPMDKLRQLERAKTYLDEYRALAGADLELVGRRLKQVDRLIRRESNRRKRDDKKKSGDDW